MGDSLLPGAYIEVIAARARQVTRLRKLFLAVLLVKYDGGGPP
jgi:hypothetical protein